MDDLIYIIPIILFIVIWWFTAKKLKPKHGFLIRNILGFVLGFLIMIISVVIMAPESENKDTNKTATTETLKDEVSKTDNLVGTNSDQKTIDFDLTALDLLHNLNLSLKVMGLPINVDTEPKVQVGSVNDVININLDDNLAFMATINKNSELIKSITLIGSGDGTEESGLRIMLAGMATFMAASDQVGDEYKEKYVKLVTGMLQKTDMSAEDATVKDSNDKYIYTITRSELLGTWFTVEPKQ